MRLKIIGLPVLYRIFPRVINEILYQFNLLSTRLQESLCLRNNITSVIVATLFGIGIVRMLFCFNSRKGFPLRYLPVILSIVIFPLSLSSYWDRRYTYFLTVIMSFVMVFGLDYILIYVKKYYNLITKNKNVS